jgi:hypothetical protein
LYYIKTSSISLFFSSTETTNIGYPFDLDQKFAFSGVIEEVHSFLSQIPGLTESVTMEKAMSFVWFTSQLTADYDPATAPTEIPKHVTSFLGCATDIPKEFVSSCWSAFSDTIWSYSNMVEAPLAGPSSVHCPAAARSSGASQQK